MIANGVNGAHADKKYAHLGCVVHGSSGKDSHSGVRPRTAPDHFRPRLLHVVSSDLSAQAGFVIKIILSMPDCHDTFIVKFENPTSRDIADLARGATGCGREIERWNFHYFALKSKES